MLGDVYKRQVLHGITKDIHSGGSVAAPIFSKVVGQSIHALESGS